ncbi:MAG TPA: extracellular solute-binding protein [Alphaproteobacteria bacterium]
MRRALLAFAILLGCTAAAYAQTKISHALSLIGEPKYGPDFKQLDYVNADAPKGGEIKLAALGGFDSLNPFIPKGDEAPGLNLIYETLMTSTMDDDTSDYGLIAESVEVPDDKSWVAFNLRPQARWADGAPITADDVVWSFEQIKQFGNPTLQLYYANVQKAEALGPRKVKFSFSGPTNRELPQIMGQMPVVQKALWEKRGFDKVTLEPWAGSGPYRIKEFQANRYIVYERREDWWGNDLPINKGRYNFKTIEFDSYRDSTVTLEAFKSGQYDFRVENIARQWATAYDFPAVQQGLVKKEEVRHERPTGMMGFVFNLRRDKFQDLRVRRALTLAFDFEWTNKTFFYGGYTRTNSYFSNSVFAARGEPSAGELALLEPFRDKVPPEVFGPAYKAPISDGSGVDRKNLRAAAKLLKEAGWTVKDGALRNAKGEAFTIEFLLGDPSFERIIAPWGQALQRLGIKLDMRTVDSSQYVRLLREYNYDMMVGSWPQSNSPGNEQRYFFSSRAADNPASRNWAGIKNEVVDALIDKIIYAPDRPELITATRAMDRVLSWNQYVVPGWSLRADRIAYWDKFGMPKSTPKNGVDIFSWWIDPAKAAKLRAARQ